MSTLGNMLIEARKQAGLTAHDVAQRTHIRQSAIFNLEDDDHDKGLAVGYVRGYILSYCKICGVNPAPYLEQYERQFGGKLRASTESTLSDLNTRHMPRRQEHEMTWKVAGAIAAVIVVIVGAILIFRGNDDYLTLGASPLPVAITATGSGGTPPPVSEEDRTSFPFSVRAREGRASDVRVVVDGNIAFDGALTSGNERNFTGTFAELQIANPENVMILQDDNPINIPDDGLLTLTAVNQE